MSHGQTSRFGVHIGITWDIYRRATRLHVKCFDHDSYGSTGALNVANRTFFPHIFAKTTVCPTVPLVGTRAPLWNQLKYTPPTLLQSVGPWVAKERRSWGPESRHGTDGDS